MMKFICKEFWNVAFRKPIDNLRTNHKVWLADALSSPFHGCVS